MLIRRFAPERSARNNFGSAMLAPGRSTFTVVRGLRTFWHRRSRQPHSVFRLARPRARQADAGHKPPSLPVPSQTMTRFSFQSLADRLLVADAGLARLTPALRSALASTSSATLGVAFAVDHAFPVTVGAPGILFAMIAPLFVRDASFPGWLRSLLSLWTVVCATFAAAAALAPTPALADAGFLAVLFAGMSCQSCSPRNPARALMAVVSYYLGLYLHPPLHALPTILLVSCIGPAMVLLAGRVIVPVRRDFALRLALRTVILRARRVRSAAHGHAGDPHGRGARQALSALNEAALALEDRLELFAPRGADALRGALVELEVAAGVRLFAGAPDTADDRALHDAIRRVEQCARRPRETPHTHGHPHGPRPGWRATVDAWRKRYFRRAGYQWDAATRATAAALAALLAGEAWSAERAYWAVITTFVVFLGTRSRGDTAWRVSERVAGTLAGALAGAALLRGFHGEPAAIVCAMALCVFGWAYCILWAYGAGVFFITMLIGLVYGELGFAIGPLFELRIGEVLIGCAISLVVAATLRPLATTRHVDARFAAVLDALVALLRSDAAPVDAGGSEGAAARRHATLRALDRAWHDYRVASRPLQTQRFLLRDTHHERVMAALHCCVHWARAAHREGIQGVSERDAQALASIAARLAAPGNASAAPVAPEHEAASPALRQLEGAVTGLLARAVPANGARPRTAAAYCWTFASRLRQSR